MINIKKWDMIYRRRFINALLNKFVKIFSISFTEVLEALFKWLSSVSSSILLGSLKGGGVFDSIFAPPAGAGFEGDPGFQPETNSEPSSWLPDMSNVGFSAPPLQYVSNFL
jgi:hypothetical protein